MTVTVCCKLHAAFAYMKFPSPSMQLLGGIVSGGDVDGGGGGGGGVGSHPPFIPPWIWKCSSGQSGVS